MPEALIVAAARSPIGRAVKGSLAGLRADDLATQIVGAALEAVPQAVEAGIDDLLLGCALPGGEQGNNLARVVAVQLGHDHLPGTTVTRYCASSLQTSRMAMHAIKAGEGHIFVSAGVESVSGYAKGTSDSLPGTRNGRFARAQARTAASAQDADGRQGWRDPREQDELPDVYLPMGQTAENVAQLKNVSRHEMDAFAVRSQHLAERAAADGFWAREITPVTMPDGTTVRSDDGPRLGVTYEAVARLDPVFRPRGRVTAGNSCPLNDGAAALVIASDVMAARLGLSPLARIVATGVSALSPEIMGLGPVEASRRALARAGLTMADMDLVEINEAFAAQVIPSYQELGVDLDRLNVNGGAIAMGHPFGSSGARLTMTLIHALRERGQRFGLVAMCVAGGQGMAMVVERLG